VPAGVRDLTYGTPDAALLPALAPALARVDPRSRLYGEPVVRPELLALARARFESEGLPAANLTVVSGALDGVERVLQAHLRPGDRVAVEDPGFSSAFDLLNALGLDVEPVAIDDHGPLPADLARALARRVDAFLLTPRAQNPTGAALDATRAGALRAVLRRHPDVLVIEDDHAGPVAGAAAVTVCDDERRRFAVIRSVSKSLGPDLRLAVLAGDAATVARVEGRQAVGAGWVSHILQDIVVALWSDARVARQLDAAAARYTARRQALLAALARHGIAAHGRSGLNVWIPVSEEVAAVRALLDAGFAVSAGERFRVRSAPAIRVTTATLEPDEATRLAAALVASFAPVRRTHAT
jgi:DNA-binding transcriptional MocR family regulator